MMQRALLFITQGAVSDGLVPPQFVHVRCGSAVDRGIQDESDYLGNIAID